MTQVDAEADLKRVLVSLAIISLVAVVAAAAAGCGGTAEPQGASGQKQAVADPSRTVTMNGRSVGELWMKHWGFVWDGPVSKEGYFLDYKALDADNIPSSFSGNVEGLVPGSVVFFKFCFADFDGSNLSQREHELEQVLATAKEKGLKLIVGNALPVRKQDGTPEIVSEERKFDAFLAAKAASVSDVWVYDMNSVLAGGDGFLKPEYASEDSHPNDAAFTALDVTFFPLLADVFAGKHGG